MVPTESNKRTYGCSREGQGEGTVRKFGTDMHTRLYLRWIPNKDLLCSPANSAQRHVTAWMGAEFGGEWIHVQVWLSPFAVHLKPLQHCKSAIGC